MSVSYPHENMFPSSDPAIHFPATSQTGAVNWQAPGYPGDQQNTQWQTIAGNGPANDDGDFDGLFDDDGEELGPEDDFGPSNWSTKDQPPADPVYKQRTPEPPLSHSHQQIALPQSETRQSCGYSQDPNGNMASFHASSATYDDGSHLTVKNHGVVSQYEPDATYQPPPRQQSLKPNPPYSGYARNSVSAGPEYQGASDIPIAGVASSNVGDLYSDEEGDFQRAFEVSKSSFFNVEKAVGAFRNAEEDMNETPHASMRSQIATPQQSFWAPDVLDDEEEFLEEEAEAEGFETGHDIKHHHPSPTESELAKRGFEFHSELEEEQIARFNDKAFRKALREVRPELPRKQQWYAYRRVVDMLVDNGGQTEYDGYDLLQPQRDFPVEKSKAHHICQRGGDRVKCFCAPGQCGCSGCLRNDSVDEEPNGSSRAISPCHANLEDEQDDAPMQIGTTPITPRFPNIYYQHRIQKIPGLGKLPEESKDEVQSLSRPIEQKHRCRYGDDRQCPPGSCQCTNLDAVLQTPQYNADRLAEYPSRWLIKRAAESQPSYPDKTTFATTLQPESHPSDPPSSTQGRPYYTPQQGFSFVRSNHSSEASTPLGEPPQITPVPPSRPDTPRPHDSDVRESVEPEMPMPNWHRESTPAYTDRSLSPSPTSHSPNSRHSDVDDPNEMDRRDGIDDLNMRDITPTVPASRGFHRSRRGSSTPGSLASFSRSRLSVPRTSSPTITSSPTRHLMPAPRFPRPESRPSSPRRLPDRDDTPRSDGTAGPSAPKPRHSIAAPPIPSSTAPGLKKNQAAWEAQIRGPWWEGREDEESQRHRQADAKGHGEDHEAKYEGY